MGETKGKNRKGSGGNLLLILTGALMLIVIGLAVHMIPHIGNTFAAYGKSRSELKTVRAELKAEQKKRDAKIKEKQTIELDDDEIDALKTETFALAAQLEADIKAGRNKNRICYLTFDDGPYYRGKSILDILNRYDVKATFFLTTANGDRLPDNAQYSAASMYSEYLRYGHTIGNHTYSHDYSEGGIYRSANAFMKDVKKQEDFTADATGGFRPQLIRFPGGRATAGGTLGDIEEKLSAGKYGWADWTIDSGDSWGTSDVSPKLIMKQIKDAAKDQNVMVVLCHEWSANTEKALPEMIEYLEGKGYIFLPMFYESSEVFK